MPVLVKDIMVNPLTVDPNESVLAVGKKMSSTRRDAVMVIKNKHPIGIITDSDLIKKIIAKSVKSSNVKAKDIMSRPVVTASPEETILDASRKMKKNNIKRLPVMDGGELVGIISLSDIARTSPEMLDLLEYKLKMKEMPTEIKEKFTAGVCDSCDNYFEDLTKVGDQWLCESCRDELKE